MKRMKTMFSRQNRECKGISRAKLDAAVSFGVEALEGRRLLSAAVPSTPTLNHFIGGSETSLSFQFTDNATNETGFRVDRQVENGPFIPFATLPANPGTGLVGYVDNTVAPDTIYRYQITALNGTTESSPSLFAAASVTPSTPYAFSVTALSPTAVQLTFYDGSNIESGFGVSALSGIGVLSVNSYTFPAHPGTGFVTETINNLNSGTKYEFTLSVTTKFSSSAGATSPITITMPTIAAGGASISGTVIGNPGAEQVYLDLQGVGTYVAGDPITTTDAQGKYNFTGLNAGNYLVRIKPQPGIFTTSPIYGGKYFVQLAANQVVTGDDFIVKSLNVLATANGQFIVAGKYPNNTVYNIMSRYNADGTTDVTFGTFGSITVSGSVTGDAISGTVQPNGNIVVTYPGTVVTLDHNGNTLSIVSRGETINTPTKLTATATSANSIQIGFTDNSVSGVSEIFIERATSATGPFSDIGLFAFEPYHAQPLSDSLTDASAQPNTTYYYRIYSRSTSTTTQSAYVGPVSATTPAAAGANISGTVTVTGTGSPGNIQVYLDLQGFGAYVGGDPIATPDAQGNYTFTGLQPGNYLLRIKPQAGVFTTTPVWGGKYFVQLSANQVVTGDDFQVQNLPSFSLRNQFLAYGVDAVSGNNYLKRFNVDGATDVTFGGANGALGTVNLPATVTGNPTAASIAGNGNIVVTYPISVVTLSGTGAIISVVPTGNAVNAPTGLTAIATSPTSVQLGFTDNATNDNGFVIERSTTVGGPFVGVGTLPGSLTGPSTGFVGFTDKTVAPNTNYYYRVYGVSGATQSAIAGPVGATTPPVVTGGGSISGTVFNDANDNGVQDGSVFPDYVSEPPVAGRQVYLDLNGIGVFANGDPIITTDAAGHYSFTGLAASNYLVRLVPLTGTVITSPVYGGKYFVQLAPNQVVTGDNFGTQAVADTTILNVSLTFPNGKILVARPQFIDVSLQNSTKAAIVTRYNADGSVDVTFGSIGSATIPLTPLKSFVGSYPKQLLQLPNGNTLAVTEAGHLSNTNSDDTQFAIIDPNGNVIRAVNVSSHTGSTGSSAGDFAKAYAVAPDGRILAAGFYDFRSFSSVAANTLVVWRFNADLTPDATFGTNGRADIGNLIGTPTAVVGLAGGGVTVSYGNDSFNLSNTGQLQLDASRILPVATGVAATPISPNQVVVQFTDNAMTEQFYNVESSFDGQNNWRIVGTVQGSAATGPRLFITIAIPGVTSFYRVRAVNGVVQSDPSAVVTATTPSAGSTRIVLGNGKIVTTYNEQLSVLKLVTYVARFNADGTKDTTFGTGGRVEIGEVLPPSSNNYSVPQILVKPDGTLVVLSLNTYSASNTKGTIATLTSYESSGNVIRFADVTSDIGVGSPHGPDIEQIALASDGKVLVVGTNAVFGQTPYSYIARFNADFTPDSTFGTFTPDPTFGTPTKGLNLTNIGMMNPADGIAQLPDGNIIAAFGSYAVLVNSSGVIQPPGFNAPTNLSGSAVANNQVHLQFTDNAVNETGFVVERSRDGGTTWGADVRPASNGTGIVQYDDSTALPSTTYLYRVFAVNGSLRTGNSATVSVTTPA